MQMCGQNQGSFSAPRLIRHDREREWTGTLGRTCWYCGPRQGTLRQGRLFSEQEGTEYPNFSTLVLWVLLKIVPYVFLLQVRKA